MMYASERLINSLDIDEKTISELKIGQEKFPKFKCKEKKKRMKEKQTRTSKNCGKIFKRLI